MTEPRVSISRHIRAVLALPGIFSISLPLIAANLVPLWGPAWLGIHPGWRLPAVLAWLPMAAGAAAMLVGAMLLSLCVARFHRAGGTLAPFDSPDKLVVEGPYAHCRNPMFLGIFTFMFGFTALLGSLVMTGYLILFIAVIVFIETRGEERRLSRHMPGYDAYRAAVPAWGWRHDPYRTVRP